ncbi:MAG TPA: hypothetical protein VGO08_19535, partial [Burkholderiales bacterium]|nr:hypothetical protein [Burkholderiales bacterium]
ASLGALPDEREAEARLGAGCRCDRHQHSYDFSRVGDIFEIADQLDRVINIAIGNRTRGKGHAVAELRFEHLIA